MKDCSFKTRIFRNCLFLLNLISWDEIVWGSFYAHNFLKHFNTELFCPVSPEWQIASSNKGTFVRLIRKVEPQKKTICCYKVNWFLSLLSIITYHLAVESFGCIINPLFGWDGCILYNDPTIWGTKRVSVIKWSDYLIFSLSLAACFHWSIGVFRWG